MATLQTGLCEEDEQHMPAIINNFRPPRSLAGREVKLFNGEVHLGDYNRGVSPMVAQDLRNGK